MVTTYLSETHCYYVNAIARGNNIMFLCTGINPSVELKKHPKPKSKFQMFLNLLDRAYLLGCMNLDEITRHSPR